MTHHYWIRGRCRRDRQSLIAELDLPPTLAVIDAHRRLRGPYTAAGTLLRSIAGDALTRCPELGPNHHIEIATAAPELASAVPPTWTTLEWMVGTNERTRFYSRLHTFNIANGLAELLRDYLRAVGSGPHALIVENLHQADPTDQEFIAVLLRRSDLSELLTVVVGTEAAPVPDPPGENAILLPQMLLDHAAILDGLDTSGSDDEVLEADAGTLARSYVDNDCTSDDARLLGAYQALPAANRAALHDARAAALAASDQSSWLLGAVPYHAVHGSDPCGAGIAALEDAMKRCMGIGLYHAAAELGLRARALLHGRSDEELWWQFTDGTSNSLATLGRADEAEAIYTEARAVTQDPARHMNLAYGMAMLYARHYAEDRRDYQQARAWMNLCITIASFLADPKKRAFNVVFGGNGLALVEVRQRHPDAALRLLNDGLARLDEELEPDEHVLHRTVLRYNRAQLFGMMGRWEDALADYMFAVGVDPEGHEHHFNIGNVLRQLGRNSEAIAAYERALQKSPPFPEAYYNRGDARRELGDVHGALADFAYTAELDPGRIDAHANRAALLYELGDFEGARKALTAGLERSPKHPHLLCLKARLLGEQGQLEAAREAVSAALGANGQISEAWAVRGELSYQIGDLAGAASDFDRAVELTDGPILRFNRAVVHQDAGHYAEAVADYEAVLAATADADAAERLSYCMEMVKYQCSS